MARPHLPPARAAAGWGDAEREAKRGALRRVLDATVGGNAGGVFYYQGVGWGGVGAWGWWGVVACVQSTCSHGITLTHARAGLHDIAAVLLFVCGGEVAAHRMLRALARGHLRDCTRPDLGAATETLSLLYPILEQVWQGRGACVQDHAQPGCHVGAGSTGRAGEPERRRASQRWGPAAAPPLPLPLPLP